MQGEREKILYLEGEPRFEVKFMRRAVEEDDNLQLVVLQRTAESKFLRLSVTDSLELQFGFPTSPPCCYSDNFGRLTATATLGVVPVPAAGWLMASALGAVAAAARLRRP